MNRTDKLVRPNVRALEPYSCARDEYQGREGIFLDANESPFGPLNRYPDPRQSELRKTISMIKGIPPENIFLGNGSDEVIDLCYRIFCSPGLDKVMMFPPTYGMYQVSAAINDTEVIKVPLDDGFDLDLQRIMPLLNDERLKLMFICSPNNPTGNCMDPDRIERIIQEFNGIIVIDEAYSDFSRKTSLLEKVSLYDNLIVMQTLSKAVGLAAARIGMAFASEDIIKYFFRMKPPYNISTINQQAALERLNNLRQIKIQIETIISERMRLAEILERLPVVKKVFPSDSNFLLVRMEDADAIHAILISNNIIVRNRGREVDGCLRITAGTRSENDSLINELEKL